jgi:hypothetical protein
LFRKADAAFPILGARVKRSRIRIGACIVRALKFISILGRET